MAKTLLYNESLISFIQVVGLSEDKKNFLCSKVSEMDLEERIELFKTLYEIFRLDLEKEEAIKRVKKYWKE
jgi:hypothetical protein